MIRLPFAPAGAVQTSGKRKKVAGLLSLDKKRLFWIAWQRFAPDLPPPIPEYEFHPERKWKFDYAWELQKVAVEIEGGIWIRKGAHNTGIAIVRDIEKYNQATVRGWRLLRFTPDQLTKDPTACVDLVRGLV